MLPQVTIGICVRNNANTIREAIESIMQQNFPHDFMELIIVDGYSQDDTLVIIQEVLKNAEFESKIYRENSGLGSARQTVVENARGKYILWLDGDMVLSRDFVKKLYQFMETHPNAGIIKGKQALVRGGNLTATLEAYSRIVGKMVNYGSEKAFTKVLGTSGCIYRTETIRNVGGFDKRLRGYGEDWDAEIKVRKAGWSLGTLNVNFLDYERNKLTWKNLWKKYWLRGYYSHYFLHKNPGFLKHYRMFPPAAFLAGLFQSHILFRLTRQKAVFFLPFQHVFKISAWYAGFIESHLKSYQPKTR